MYDRKYNISQRCLISPLIKKSSNFINKLLNRGASCYHKKILTLVNYLFLGLLLNLSRFQALYFRTLDLVELNFLELQLIDANINI